MNANQIAPVAPLADAVQHAWRGADRIMRVVDTIWEDLTGLGAPLTGDDGPSHGILSDADRLSHRLHELADRLGDVRVRINSNMEEMPAAASQIGRAQGRIA